jgi:hypothetical protein
MLPDSRYAPQYSRINIYAQSPMVHHVDLGRQYFFLRIFLKSKPVNGNHHTFIARLLSTYFEPSIFGIYLRHVVAVRSLLYFKYSRCMVLYRQPNMPGGPHIRTFPASPSVGN